MALMLRALQQLVGTKHRLQVAEGMAEIVVDHQIVVFDVVTHLADGLTHAALDDLAAVLAAIGQAVAECFAGRRQDEDRFRLGHQFAHLLGALPVDLQDQVDALGQGLFQRAL